MRLTSIRRGAALVLALGLSCTTLAAASPGAVSELKFKEPTSVTATGEKLILNEQTIADDEICEEAREISGVQGSCATEVSFSTTEAKLVDASTLSDEVLDQKSGDGVTLRAAAASGSIYTKGWSAEMIGLFYINWKEKHSGTVYWDGSRVWSTKTNRGYKGKHTCDLGRGIGYSVNVTKCSTEAVGTTLLKEWDYFKVHVVYKGAPVYKAWDMHAVFDRNGNAKHYYSK